MEFRTKREAEEAIRREEGRAAWHERNLLRSRAGSVVRADSLQAIEYSQAEAARIRALLPTLLD